MKKPIQSLLTVLATIGLAVFGLTACDNDSPAEEAGENIRDAADEVGDDVEEATDEVGDAIEDAAN